MADRLGCCIPFCKRTYANPEGYAEWICPKHWRMVHRETRKAHIAYRKKIEEVFKRHPEYREYWTLAPGSNGRLIANRMRRKHDLLWGNCKKEAMEGGAGI